MPSFFDQPEPSDDTYRTISSEQHPRYVAARAYVEDIWTQTAPYLDENLPRRAKDEFQSVFWEMYLCATLLEAGIQVTPRAGRPRQNEGPDLQLQIANVSAWCEAIAVTAGEGQDAVLEPPHGEVHDVPHDRIKLRLLSALSDKRKKFEIYASNGIVREGAPCVVAINAFQVPYAYNELEVPRIVSSVFPIGWPTVRMSLKTGKLVDGPYQFQPHVSKSNGTCVPTDTFEGHNCMIVSAVIYSTVDVFNLPSRLGADFVVVHNSNTTAPLPLGWLDRGREYCKNGEEILRCNRQHAGINSTSRRS